MLYHKPIQEVFNLKKLLCILLMLIFALPALAEANPFAPYTLAVPEAVELTENEGTYAFVYGMTRVVAMVIDRVPDEKPAEAVIRMMTQFEPEAVIGEDLPMAEGYVGLKAVNTDQFGEDVDCLTVMVLSAEGDLLILSGYDLSGSEEHVQSLLDSLLAGLTVDGTPIVISKE